MYTLYWHPDTSSLAPMAVLGELKIPHDCHRVDSAGGECDTPEYRQLQPLGLIPALGLPDGSSMFESAAMVQYLCDRHAEGNLAPAPEDPERARYLQWLYFMTDTIYPTYNRYFWPARFSRDAQGITEVRQHVATIVMKQWQVIEDALQERGPWLLGQRFSAGDIYLQMMTTWHHSPRELLDTFPAIRAVARGVLAREACYSAARRHSFRTGFEAG